MEKFKSDRRNITIRTLIGACLLPALIYFTVSLLLCAVCYSTEDPLSGVGLFSIIALIISGGTSSFINSKRARVIGFPLSLCSTVFTAIIILVLSLIFSDAQGIGIFISIGTYALVSLIFSLLARRERKRKFKRK